MGRRKRRDLLRRRNRARLGRTRLKRRIRHAPSRANGDGRAPPRPPGWSPRPLSAPRPPARVRCLSEPSKPGAGLEPSPIGFSFARLWYFERLYPLIFTVGAL